MPDIYYYLSTMPEALIASMLPPEEFGTYLAVGTEKRSRGQAMHFTVAAPFATEWFDFKRAEAACTPHDDGTPKHSVYLAVYRVLEHVPLSAIGDLFLSTDDGRVLRLEKASPPATFAKDFYLYVEICPTQPLIASTLNPLEFCDFITDEQNPIHLPKLCFVDIKTEPWLEVPEGTVGGHRTGREVGHVRSCLRQLEASSEKLTKTVDRTHTIQSWNMQIKNGFFVGNGDTVLFYPFPDRDTLERDCHDWWRSAAK
ncbi:MAG: hypothetical protein K9N51_00470 [Candidatus Pacebacteria bacterium]|nr:hypothetical protein [Candidatus Paceibacterota bacterium]